MYTYIIGPMQLKQVKPHPVDTGDSMRRVAFLAAASDFRVRFLWAPAVFQGQAPKIKECGEATNLPPHYCCRVQDKEAKNKSSGYEGAIGR